MRAPKRAFSGGSETGNTELRKKLHRPIGNLQHIQRKDT
jgi:hypothetical protein